MHGLLLLPPPERAQRFSSIHYTCLPDAAAAAVAHTTAPQLQRANHGGTLGCCCTPAPAGSCTLHSHISTAHSKRTRTRYWGMQPVACSSSSSMGGGQGGTATGSTRQQPGMHAAQHAAPPGRSRPPLPASRSRPVRLLLQTHAPAKTRCGMEYKSRQQAGIRCLRRPASAAPPCRTLRRRRNHRQKVQKAEGPPAGVPANLMRPGSAHRDVHDAYMYVYGIATPPGLHYSC